VGLPLAIAQQHLLKYSIVPTCVSPGSRVTALLPQSPHCIFICLMVILPHINKHSPHTFLQCCVTTGGSQDTPTSYNVRAWAGDVEKTEYRVLDVPWVCGMAFVVPALAIFTHDDGKQSIYAYTSVYPKVKDEDRDGMYPPPQY
jgi:hypothetical protein